jgi:hypothetical protein
VTDDERVRLAREALREITPDATVGELTGQTPEGEGVTTLTFAATMAGYPGWHWTVSVAEVPGEAPSVLETELMPGDGALLAPDWVPWSERLEEYRAAQAAAAAEAGDDEADDDDDDESDEFDDEGDGDEVEDAFDDHEDGDDDFGDDPDDGIDFESGDSVGLASVLPAEAVHVDEGGEPETDADEAGPQPPDAAGVDERHDEDE